MELIRAYLMFYCPLCCRHVSTMSDDEHSNEEVEVSAHSPSFKIQCGGVPKQACALESAKAISAHGISHACHAESRIAKYFWLTIFMIGLGEI